MKKIIPYVFVLTAIGYLCLAYLYRTPYPIDIFFLLVGKPVSINNPIVTQYMDVYEQDGDVSRPYFRTVGNETTARLDTEYRYSAVAICKNNLSQTFLIDSVVLIDRITRERQWCCFYGYADIKNHPSYADIPVPPHSNFNLIIAQPLFLPRKPEFNREARYLFDSYRIAFNIYTTIGIITYLPRRYQTINTAKEVIKDEIAP
jgi:hypothetical protein